MNEEEIFANILQKLKMILSIPSNNQQELESSLKTNAFQILQTKFYPECTLTVHQFLQKYPQIQRNVFQIWIDEFLTDIASKFYSNNKRNRELKSKDSKFYLDNISHHYFCDSINPLQFNQHSIIPIDDWEIYCILTKKQPQGSEKTSKKKYLIPAPDSGTGSFYQINQESKRISIFFEYRNLNPLETAQFRTSYQKNINKYILDSMKSDFNQFSQSSKSSLKSFASDNYIQLFEFLSKYTTPNYAILKFHPNIQQELALFVKNFVNMYWIPEILLKTTKTTKFTKLTKSTKSNNTTKKSKALFLTEMNENADYEHLIDIINGFTEILEKISTFLSLFESLRWGLRKKIKLLSNIAYLVSSNSDPQTLSSQFSAKLPDKTNPPIQNLVENQFSDIFSDILGPKTFHNGAQISPYSQFTSFSSQNISNFVDFQGLLFHGDNWDVMQLLFPRYQDTFDVIYIDPPYNTGTRDFTYQDSYDKENWLHLMDHRLLVGEKLLHPQGIFFSSIDDNQLATYSLLIDKIFPYRLNNIIWHKKTQPSYLSKELISVTEYINVAKKQEKPLKLMGDYGNPLKLTEMINIGNSVSTGAYPKEKLLIRTDWEGILEKGVYGNQKLQITLLKGPIHIISGVPDQDLVLQGRFKWTQEEFAKNYRKGD